MAKQKTKAQLHKAFWKAHDKAMAKRAAFRLAEITYIRATLNYKETDPPEKRLAATMYQALREMENARIAMIQADKAEEKSQAEWNAAEPE